MFHTQHKGKIKNEKIYRWKLELSCYTFDIQYRPGCENIVPDTFSRITCASVTKDYLYQLHDALCHPGITRFYAFVRSRNIPCSIEEIKKLTNACAICNECKPRFYNPAKSHLIKATQPMERLNLDFKGPLPTNNNHRYILTVVDEFSRFPFAIPCVDVKAGTIYKALCQIFSIFGICSYIHSDRGSGFISKELRDLLLSKGIACSRSTRYNPRGNGLVERYNNTVWKAVTLALKSRKLPLSAWELTLPDVLHSIRTLINTTTNCTPHERMFSYKRKTSTGVSLPAWLTSPGPVFLKRHVRASKYEPLVDKVHLIEANHQYAFIRDQRGVESTVSLRDLAPVSELNEVSINDTIPITLPSNDEI